MAITHKYDISTLAKSLEPGLEAIIGRELEYLVNDAMDVIRSKLVDKMTTNIKTSLGHLMNDVNINIIVEIKDK